MENKNVVVSFIKKNISLAAFVILFILFSFTTAGKFLKINNLLSVLTSSTDLLICALGGTFIILMGSIDLSVGSMISLCGVIVAKIYLSTNSLIAALLATIAVSLVCYLFMGVIHVQLKVPTFIVTLGMLSIARALVTMISGGSITMVDYNGAIKQVFGLRPWILIIAIAAFAVVFLIERFTLFGRYTRLVGGEENVARLSGINVKKQKVLVFLFAGVLTALGGIVMAARIGSGSPSVGVGYELDVITAVVLGGTSQTGGVGGVRGTLIGVLTIGILANGLVLWGMPSEVQLLIKGLVVIFAVAVSTERKPNMIVR
ncbi:ABC transporter permease [Muricomes sp. OA1]|uniref:ABC transporter permease n=3 Tax=Lachnospiraceae TaxID=186803 RepID=A0A3E2WEV6_9FIRM|nr:MULTISPECIES: ABC transporter permease [Clostridia]MEE0199177.1 ABC transporter permease [Muricomes sp.]MCH1972813.1 ABC transporter permease [Muricomes sp. OA1]MRM90961.1 ABC transporter permease [Faecalicatena contorta]RGC24218.1 ABC transporter permease [Hungatella hathewayi]GKH31582.1 ribose ABC transporter permease [Faecalicatena contorta]